VLAVAATALGALVGGLLLLKVAAVAALALAVPILAVVCLVSHAASRRGRPPALP